MTTKLNFCRKWRTALQRSLHDQASQQGGTAMPAHHRSEAPSAESWKKRRLCGLRAEGLPSQAPRISGSMLRSFSAGGSNHC